MTTASSGSGLPFGVAAAAAATRDQDDQETGRDSDGTPVGRADAEEDARRSGADAEEANPTEAPHGSHDEGGGRAVPRGQTSPYGPDEKTADDGS